MQLPFALRFAAPWLLVFGVPLVVLAAWRLRKLPREHTGMRRRAIQACIVLGIACAALALAGLEVGTRIDRMAVVFAIDRSRSVERAGQEGATEALRAVRQAIARMEPDDKAGLVVFGAEAATQVVPSPAPPLGGAVAPVARDATDIAAAIRHALADLPAEHAGRIVLVSDGVETHGDALDAAAIAAGRGVAIDVLAIERAPAAEVAVDQVRVAPYADPGEPVELRIVTRATRAADVRVRVLRDGQAIAEGTTRIEAGEDVLTMRDVAPEPGVHRYDVLLDPREASADGARDNNEGGAFLRVTGGSRALVLSERPPEAQAIAEAMRRSGMLVEVADRTGVPVDLATLASYDLLVLSDLNARALTQDQMLSIQSYVRDLGGGLLMLGAQDSFGLGGYAYTPVEEALPATFDLRRRRDRASLAMVIAIDKSGSMTMEVSPGTMKLDLANEAAARSAMLLSPFDRMGCMHVDTAVTWTIPMTPVTNPTAIASQIRHAQPGGGGIIVDLTLETAYDRLEDETTQLKHLLLFSDGSDSEEMIRARSLVERAQRSRITTTVVSMGNGPDTPELERLSRIGGGRFYIVEDMTELPRIFTQETIAASRSTIVDQPFRAAIAAPGNATRAIDFGAAPELGGYVVVNQRPRATRLLTAKKQEDPLLAVWQYGVGRSAVFASDGGARFARRWLSWPGYSALFGQLGRDLARAPERRDARLDVTVREGVARVVVEAVDSEGGYRNYLDLGATIAAPGGQRITVPLAQTGAGRYEGRFEANAPGPYLVTVREAGVGLVGSAGVVRPRGDELRGEGTDHAKLAQIAALSGGRVRRDLRDVFTQRPSPVYAYEPEWPLLVTLAVLLLLLSVAFRRLVLPGELFARVVPERVRRALKMRAPRAVPAPNPEATLAALTAKAHDRRAAAKVATEVEQALGATPTRSDERGHPQAIEVPAEPDSPGPPGGGAPPAQPGSLAEQLLERKRKRR